MIVNYWRKNSNPSYDNHEIRNIGTGEMTSPIVTPFGYRDGRDVTVGAFPH